MSEVMDLSVNVVDAEPISREDSDLNGVIDQPTSVPAIIDAEQRLIEDGCAAAERFNRSREQILPMARGLLAAKRKHPATREFNKWLQGSPYSRIGKQDRWALINLGNHEDATERFLAGTDMISPQTIWAAVAKTLKPQLPITLSYYHSKSEDGSVDTGRPADAQSIRSRVSDEESNSTRPSNDGYGKAKSSAEPWADSQRFDLVLLTPIDRDLAHLRADYADVDALRRCLPLHRAMEEDVAVVIAAGISDLPAITNFMAIYGFKRPSRVLLARRPDGADVTNAKVFIIAERGVIEFSEPESGWPYGDDPVEVAARLYPNVSRRLLIFGSKADGWQSFGWAEEPSVR
jgi:hypothetical protein